MRRSAVFPIPDASEWKMRLLAWADTHPLALCLDSNDYPAGPYAEWDFLAAADAVDTLECSAGQAFEQLRQWYDDKRDWLFGYLAYDLKNEVERLHSQHPDGIGFADLLFFQPRTVAGIRKGRLEIHCLDADPAEVYARLAALPPLPPPAAATGQPLHARIARADYLASVEAIRQHIVEGDVYEINFCQEFYAEHIEWAPLDVFRRLNARTRAPFAAFLRAGERYLMCASPERFLKKSGPKLISQPIKGTRRRGAGAEEDARIRAELAASEKDRAENVMIVDLVRNDLARHCLPGSVQVEELFGIHAFNTVYQMISTVTGILRPDAHPVEALRDAFPMGSMTGAPKVMAMQLIEQYERTRRGLYSGALGYCTPAGDFDFNVVIRSIFYNAAARYAAVLVGGAIVYDSRPELEYEECLIKADAMKKSV